MYQVLLNSELVFNFLLSQDAKKKSEFNKLWGILQSSFEDKYTGYISETEWLQLCFYVKNAVPAQASQILSNFAKVLTIGQTDESNSFVYIIDEKIISFDSNSRFLSVEQFLMHHEADKMLNLPYEERESGHIFDFERDSLTGFGNSDIIVRENDDLLDDHNVGKNYLPNSSEIDSLTGFGNSDIIVGENDDLLDNHNVGENYLPNSPEIDSLTNFSNSDIIPGENDDLLDNHNVGENYLPNSPEIDSLIDFGNSDENYLFGNDNNLVS